MGLGLKALGCRETEARWTIASVGYKDWVSVMCVQRGPWRQGTVTFTGIMVSPAGRLQSEPSLDGRLVAGLLSPSVPNGDVHSSAHSRSLSCGHRGVPCLFVMQIWGVILRFCGFTDTPCLGGHTLLPSTYRSQSLPDSHSGMGGTWSCPAVHVFSANHFPSLRLSFPICRASALHPVILFWSLDHRLHRDLRPRCPWPPGGERGQSRNVANVATWWWILGEHEQLDVALRQEKLEKQEASGSLVGERD